MVLVAKIVFSIIVAVALVLGAYQFQGEQIKPASMEGAEELSELYRLEEETGDVGEELDLDSYVVDREAYDEESESYGYVEDLVNEEDYIGDNEDDWSYKSLNRINSLSGDDESDDFGVVYDFLNDGEDGNSLKNDYSVGSQGANKGLRYNYMEDRWEYAGGNEDLKYNYMDDRWEHASDDESLKYNYIDDKWDYAKDDDSLQYNYMEDRWDYAAYSSQMLCCKSLLPVWHRHTSFQNERLGSYHLSCFEHNHLEVSIKIIMF